MLLCSYCLCVEGKNKRNGQNIFDKTTFKEPAPEGLIWLQKRRNQVNWFFFYFCCLPTYGSTLYLTNWIFSRTSAHKYR
jgi:hypothetical protein